jgi:hypothetical protein
LPGSFPNGVHPGKLSQGQCLVSWAGKEHTRDQWQVLLLRRAAVTWIPIERVSPYLLAQSGVSGGTVNGYPLYISRRYMSDGLHPGKYTHDGICYIPWGGRENTYKSGCEVLFANR